MTDVQVKNPVNIAAERAVLSGLCQFGQEALIDVMEILNSDCFTAEINRNFYLVVKDVLNESKEIDLANFVAKSVVLGMGDISQNPESANYVKSLFSYNVKRESIVGHAKLLRKLSIARQGMVKAREIYNELATVNGTESVSSIVSKMEQPIFDMVGSINTTTENSIVKIGEGIIEYVDYLKTEKPEIIGIPSPWAIYNDAIGNGRRRGGLYLTAARPKTGKSSFAISDGLHVASLGIPVLYLDTEMKKDSQQIRILASLADVPMKVIETGKFGENDFELGKVVSAAKKIENLPFSYVRVAGLQFDEILSFIRRWIVQSVGTSGGKTNDCLIIYDYFKLMDSNELDKMQEYQVVGFQCQKLTDFCSTYDVTCSAYVQMNRQGIQKETTDVLSQSDRLLWFCSSLSLLKRKSKDEFLQDGPENGNMKLYVTEEQRFGPGLEDGDWINFGFKKDRCLIKEIGLNSEKTEHRDDSFSLEDASDEPEFTDEEFDSFDFGDSRYRKN